MRIAVLGINHKSSDLQLREELARVVQRSLLGENLIADELGAVILSTCNRTEIYFSQEDLAVAHTALLAHLRSEIPVPFEHKLYSYFGADCFAHLALVTAGLDSLIPCETEIQRQVKMAYAHASLYRKLPSSIHFLFQKSLKIGKALRSNVSLSSEPVTLPSQLFEMIHATLKTPSIFFLGHSEINRKIITYFRKRGEWAMTLCTRAPHSAEEFATKQQITLVDWSKLRSWQEYDVVIAGTTHHDYLILPEQLTSPPQTTFIFDLGIPRNTDPRLRLHPHLTLMNIEELGHILERWGAEEEETLKQAEESVRADVDRQLEIYLQKTTRRVFQCIS